MNASSRGTIASWIAASRIFVGILFLYEITLGLNWKLFNPEWMGDGAGTWLLNNTEEAIETATWGWSAWYLQEFVDPYASIMSEPLFWFQFILGVCLVLGLFTRPLLALGIAHVVIMLISGHSRVPPFWVAMFLSLLALNAGMYYGVDAFLSEKFKSMRSGFSRLMTFILELRFPDWTRLYVALPAIIVTLSYFLLQAVAMGTMRFRMVSMDIVVLLGLTAFGLMLAKNIDRLALVARLIGIFVGYRFLHEIWVRATPALNGLPGNLWASADQLSAPFQIIAENHFSVFAWVAQNMILPYAGWWVVVFGLIQLSVGLMLILGWKTRIASWIGFTYLAFLLALGFSRYVPFVFGLLIFSYVFRPERVFSLDALRLNFAILPAPALSRNTLYGLSMLTIVAFVTAFVGGIIPGNYVKHMGPTMAAMFVLIALPVSVAGVFQVFFGKESVSE